MCWTKSTDYRYILKCLRTIILSHNLYQATTGMIKDWDLAGLGSSRTGIIKDWNWTQTGQKQQFREKERKHNPVLQVDRIYHRFFLLSKAVSTIRQLLCCQSNVSYTRRLQWGRQLSEVATMLWCHCQDMVDGEFDLWLLEGFYCRGNQYTHIS